MNQSQTESFLRGVGSQKISHQPRKGWLNAGCPLARWKHTGGKDNNPSFAVSIHPNGRSWCKCLSCGFSGTPQMLVEQLDRYGAYITPSARSLAIGANLINLQDSFERRKTSFQQRYAQEPTQEYYASEKLPSMTRELAGITVPAGVYYGSFDDLPEPLDESVLQHLMDIPAHVMAYLTGAERNLMRNTILEWELGYHAPSGRVTIPVYDFKKRLINVTGRAFDGEPRPKWRHGDGFKSELYLFGENRVIPGRRGYLFEGNFDPIYFSQLGYTNGVALMGVNLSSLKMEKIRQWFPEVYIALDPDKAGKEGSEKLKRQLAGVVPYKEIHMPADVDLLGAQTCWSLFGSPYQ